MPKLGSDGKIHISIVKRKRPDGSRYVQEVRSIYDPKTKNSKVISSTTKGILPPGETDLSKLIPSDGKRGPKKKAALAREIPVITDSRQGSLVQYPLDIVLLVIVLAGLGGFLSCRQIAEYWKLHRPVFKAWFADFPDQDISHDTIRNVIRILGKGDVNKLIEQYTIPLPVKYQTRIVALDGQAVCAASSLEHKAHSRYVLNLFDTDNEMCLQQILIEEKENEITQAVNIVTSMDLSGAIFTCDAMNTQKKLAEFLLYEKHCDYCFAVKGNHKELHSQVCGWFKTKQGWSAAKEFARIELGHGRTETREISVLPASVMKEFAQDVLDKWAGLEDGCIVMARIKREFADAPEKNSDEVRYFITSLHFDKLYIAATLARVIRRHWMIENGLHWVLDVTFNQDRTQCRNADFLAGVTGIRKIIFNLISKAQSVQEAETGRQAAHKPSWKVRLKTPASAMELFAKLYRHVKR